jgi:hypothetical protein
VSELWAEYREIAEECDISVVFLDGESVSFQVGIDEDGLWPTVRYTPFGLLVKYHGGNEQFIPWTAIRTVIVHRIY